MDPSCWTRAGRTTAFPCLLFAATALAALTVADSARAAPQQFARSYGSEFLDEVLGIREMPDHSIVSVGWEFDLVRFEQAAKVRRTDAAGNLLWCYRFDPADRCSVSAVEATAGNDLIVVGSQQSRPWLVRLDGLTGQVLWQERSSFAAGAFACVERMADGEYVAAGWGQTFDTSTNALVCRFDVEGDVRWQVEVGDRGIQSAQGLTACLDGGCVIAGRVQRGPSSEVWVEKLDADGKAVWSRSYAVVDGFDQYANVDVDQTPSGQYFLTSARFQDGSTADDVWVARLDANGDLLWQKDYDLVRDYPRRVLCTPDDGCLLVADCSDTGSPDDRDVWLLRVNAGGSILWQRRYGGTHTELAVAVDGCEDGDFLVAGMTESFVRPGDQRSDDWVLRVGEDGSIGPCASYDWTTYGSGRNVTCDTDIVDEPVVDVPIASDEPNVFHRWTDVHQAVQCATVAEPWQDLGEATAGTRGDPALVGVSVAEEGAYSVLLFENLLQNSSAFLVVGTTEIYAPWLGGVLVPAPQFLLRGLRTGQSGRLLMEFSWPSGIPSDSRVSLQALVHDPAAPKDFAFTNAVRVITP